MIVCLNLNPCVDTTYVLDPEEHDEVESTNRCLGGEGLNAARNLKKLGRETQVVGYMTADDCPAFERILNAYRIAYAFVEFETGQMRTDEKYIRKAVLHSRRETPGATVGSEQENKLLEVYREQAASAEAIVLAGKLPEGAAPDFYARLTVAAPEGVPVILDTCGEALKKAVPKKPALVKVNEEELAEYADAPAKNAKKRRKAAERMLEDGAERVLVSLARDGAELFTKDGTFSARQKNIVAINPAGGGSGMLAAVTDALLSGCIPEDLVLRAVAGGSEKVLEVNASDFDKHMYESFWDNIEVKRL